MAAADEEEDEDKRWNGKLFTILKINYHSTLAPDTMVHRAALISLRIREAEDDVGNTINNSPGFGWL